MNASYSNDSQGSNLSEHQVPLLVLLFFVGQGVVSIIGNILIVILVYRDNKMKTSVGKLTVNQAIADGAVSALFFGLDIYERVFKPDQSNRLIAFTIVRVCLVGLYSESFHTLAGAAFSLYMAICHPVKFRMYNKTWIVAVFIASTWLLNISVGCLIFTTDNSIVHDDIMLFSFYRLQPNAIWYAVLKMIVMFTPPLLSFIWLTKIWIYKRTTRNEEVQAQSDSVKLISQAQGILLFHLVYSLAFILRIVTENIFPVNSEHETYPISSLIIYVVVSLYLTLKLPLFLLAFKPYRKVATDMFCPCRSRNHDQPFSAHNSSDQRAHTSQENQPNIQTTRH